MLRYFFSIYLLVLSDTLVAAELTSGGVVVSHTRQGLLAMESGLGAATVNYDLELTTENVINDILSFQFSVGLAQGTLNSLPVQLICDGLAPDSDSVIFGYLDGNEDTGVVRYRLIRANNGSATDTFSSLGLHCVTPVISVDPTQLSQFNEATITVELTSGYGYLMDRVGPVTVANVIDAYSLGVDTFFDEIVEVGDALRSFVGQDAANSSDQVHPTLIYTEGTDGDLLVKSSYAPHTVTPASIAATDVQTTAVELRIVGDFSFLDTSIEPGMQLGSNSVAGTDYEITFSDDASVVTASNLSPAIVVGDNGSPITISKNEAESQIINQVFTGEIEVFFDDNAQSVTLPYSNGLGEWGWNGTEVYIYAMPFDDNVSRTVGVSNQGSYAFDVTANVHHQETVYGPFELGSAAANSITQFSEALDQAMADAGYSLSSGRGNIVLQLAATESNTMVYGGYKLDTDLTFVNLATSAQTNLVTP